MLSVLEESCCSLDITYKINNLKFKSQLLRIIVRWRGLNYFSYTNLRRISNTDFGGYLRWFWLACGSRCQFLTLHRAGVWGRVWIHSVTYIMTQQSLSMLLNTNSFLVISRTQRLEFKKKYMYLVEKMARKRKSFYILIIIHLLQNLFLYPQWISSGEHFAAQIILVN